MLARCTQLARAWSVRWRGCVDLVPGPKGSMRVSVTICAQTSGGFARKRTECSSKWSISGGDENRGYSSDAGSVYWNRESNHRHRYDRHLPPGNRSSDLRASTDSTGKRGRRGKDEARYGSDDAGLVEVTAGSGHSAALLLGRRCALLLGRR